MLDCHVELLDLRQKKIQGVVVTIMIAFLLSTNNFGRCGYKEVKLWKTFFNNFSFFITVISVDYQIQMNNGLHIDVVPDEFIWTVNWLH